MFFIDSRISSGSEFDYWVKLDSEPSKICQYPDMKLYKCILCLYCSSPTLCWFSPKNIVLYYKIIIRSFRFLKSRFISVLLYWHVIYISWCITMFFFHCLSTELGRMTRRLTLFKPGMFAESERYFSVNCISDIIKALECVTTNFHSIFTFSYSFI